MIDHQEMIGEGVELVPVAPGLRGDRVRMGAHFGKENPVAQRQRGVDFPGGFGDADAEVARAQLSHAGWH